MAQDYDVTLKILFRAASPGLLREICGDEVVHWHDKELPRVINRRSDLIGESPEGNLVHIEFVGDPDLMASVKLAIYYLEIFLKFGQYPTQTLIYAGRRSKKIAGVLKAPKMDYWFKAVNLSDYDGELYSRSAEVADQILATLMRVRSGRRTIRRVLSSIAVLEGSEREDALNQLLVISGLKKLEFTVEQEVRKMPILMSLMDHGVIGREFKKGLKQGKEEGREEGREEGLEEGIGKGVEKILRIQLVKRFGDIPPWAEAKLRNAKAGELDRWSERILDAGSIRSVFQR